MFSIRTTCKVGCTAHYLGQFYVFYNYRNPARAASMLRFLRKEYPASTYALFVRNTKLPF